MNNSLPCHHCGLKSTRRGLCGDRDGASQEFFGSTGHWTHIWINRSVSEDCHKDSRKWGKKRDLSFETQELQPLFNSNTVLKCQLYEKLEPSARASCKISKKTFALWIVCVFQYFFSSKISCHLESQRFS